VIICLRLSQGEQQYFSCYFVLRTRGNEPPVGLFQITIKMDLYAFVAGLHVIVAVGGLGQISAIGVMSRKPKLANLELMRQLFRAVGGSLVVMLITGVILMLMSNGIFEHAWWLRIAIILFLGLGAVHGIGQGTLKKIIATGQPLESSPLHGKLRTMSLLSSILLVVMVYLMEAKPF